MLKTLTKQQKTIVFLIVASILATFIYFKQNTSLSVAQLKDQLKSARLMPEPRRILNEFTLIDHNKSSFTNNDFKNQWSLVLFGFTSCPDVCPIEMNVLAKVGKKIEKDFVKIMMPKVYMISIDPFRDTPEVLSRYVPFFNPSFIGLTGNFEELKKVSRSFASYFEYEYHAKGVKKIYESVDDMPDEHKQNYIVNHTAKVYLVDPEGNMVAFFSYPLDAEAFTIDLALLLSN